MEHKKRKYRLKKNVARVISIFILTVLCISGIIFAKYYSNFSHQSGAIHSSNFYFTVDLLGDTNMVPTDRHSEDVYSFTNESTSGTWQLYGGNEHNIKINVQNYYDDLRINQNDIKYKVSIETDDSALEDEISISNNNSIVNDAYVLSGGNKQSDTLTIGIPSCSSLTYQDGTIVTVKISSLEPYKKTLTLKFVLHATEAALKYRVIDSVGSPYAQLVLMTNLAGTVAGGAVQPYVMWPEDLSIDNTNKLTFTINSEESFIQQDGLAARKIQLSESLQSGRSETIYFFKEYPSKNYSITDQVVIKDADGKFTIDLTSLGN